jgi:hypothetical protein
MISFTFSRISSVLKKKKPGGFPVLASQCGTLINAGHITIFPCTEKGRYSDVICTGAF